MRFELKTTIIVFHDNKPGECAMMFCNGCALTFRPDLSTFNDGSRIYSWAFEGQVGEGDTIVFATKDREVTGVLQGRTLVVQGATVSIDRSRDGKPLRTSQRAPQRPVAMTGEMAKKLL